MLADQTVDIGVDSKLLPRLWDSLEFAICLSLDWRIFLEDMEKTILFLTPPKILSRHRYKQKQKIWATLRKTVSSTMVTKPNLVRKVSESNLPKFHVFLKLVFVKLPVKL